MYYTLKHLQFERTDKNVKLDITFHVIKQNCDINNLFRITIDSLNKIVFNDVRQVVQINCKKIIGSFKKTEILIYIVE